MSGTPEFDVVIVGAGVAGALIASRLTGAGLRVRILEAGPDTAQHFEDYTANLQQFYGANAKGPESPWTPALAAPQPDTGDLRQNNGYFIQRGPQLYGSSYTRRWGGSTLHWLGVSLRMLPEDFRMSSRHGVARDWPLGYDALAPYYGQAEHTLGVAADAAEQAYLGLSFPNGYDYPMRRIPPSWSDQALGAAVNGMTVTLGSDQVSLKVRSYPAARNGVPRGDYIPQGAVDIRADGEIVERYLGQRCAGNTACTPICPIQARYHAGKTIARAIPGGLSVLSQAVASTIVIDPVDGAVRRIEYKRYDDLKSASFTLESVTARLYILAAHTIENAKLLLGSGISGHGGTVGQGLMDHPALYAWGLAPVPVGAFRGPLSTSGIEDCRGGSFRAKHASFRYDIGNDGWRATTGAPDTTVVDAVTNRGLYGKKLRAALADTLARQVRMSLAVEQLPDPGNKVSIDPAHRDAIGNPVPIIDYHIDDYTKAGMVAAAGVSRTMFRRAGIEDRTGTDSAWFPSVSFGGETFHYHGMGHFAGTHAMGDDPATSVVDPDQRAWGHRNLFVVGAGSFVTMGTSNPTLTIAALALRTADRILATLNEGGLHADA
ncbi:MAG: GMC family oxidoreductase [Rhodopila sp.]|jgi:choline dehydrogenase-like flavoprotein